MSLPLPWRRDFSMMLVKMKSPLLKKKKKSVFLNRWKEDRSGPLSAIITLVLLLNVISLFSCKP